MTNHNTHTNAELAVESVSRRKKNNPAIAEAVERYLDDQRAKRKKDIANLESVLRGPRHRVIGRKAAGPALARSELGNLTCRRATAEDFQKWFTDRHPAWLAQDTTKRGMSAMRGFLTFCVRKGWMDERILDACFTVVPSNPQKAWLHPEQVVAISALVETADEVDGYEEFGVVALRDLGARTAELPRMKAHHLDPRTKTVKVTGKGTGEGKEREIPVDDVFIERWRAHIDRYGIRPDGYMFFHRHSSFIPGTRTHEWVIDKSRPSTTRPFLRIMRKVADLAARELDPELVPHFPLTPKVMRKTFACTQLILHALNLGGMDVRSLQVAMGHARLDTTQRYLADAEQYIGAVKRHVNTGDGARLITEVRQGLKDAS
jgi:site-specific recombinase XerD